MRTCGFMLCCALLTAIVPFSFDQSANPRAVVGVTPADTQATLLQEDTAAGLELWDTMLGRLWIPRPGIYVIKHLQWEQKVQRVYHHPLVHVRSGDVVIDCGAHIGGFTRIALAAGARMVVAIEPERANILAFRRNLEPEIKAGRVKLVEKGVWDTTGRLPLHTSDVGDSHSMVVPQSRHQDEIIDVTTLDLLVESLKLSRIDFIKMDIEGAERNALRGARKVIQRWNPRLAISSYHLKGDPAAIAGLVWEFHRGYLIESKDLEKGAEGFVPKVLFFH
jgi:FkbM family methyltransferase